jgi:ribonuclease P protein component
MLPAERRVRRPEEFAVAVRDGRRVGASGLVLHLRTTAGTAPSRAGFVVGRNVGTAVVRNRIRRQLRHLIAPRLVDLPVGTDLVLRALPAASTLSRRELAATLTALLERLQRSAATT